MVMTTGTDYEVVWPDGAIYAHRKHAGARH